MYYSLHIIMLYKYVGNNATILMFVVLFVFNGEVQQYEMIVEQWEEQREQTSFHCHSFILKCHLKFIECLFAAIANTKYSLNFKSFYIEQFDRRVCVLERDGMRKKVNKLWLNFIYAFSVFIPKQATENKFSLVYFFVVIVTQSLVFKLEIKKKILKCEVKSHKHQTMNSH